MSALNDFHSAQLYDQLQADAGVEHEERMRPSRVLPVRVFIDGDRWCVLFGDNIQDGVAGFGATPEEASTDFDRRWKGAAPTPGATTPEWTTEPPTEPGWYWHRDSAAMQPTRLIEVNGSMWCTRFGSSVKAVGGEWWPVPIPPPKGDDR